VLSLHDIGIVYAHTAPLALRFDLRLVKKMTDYAAACCIQFGRLQHLCPELASALRLERCLLWGARFIATRTERQLLLGYCAKMSMLHSPGPYGARQSKTTIKVWCAYGARQRTCHM